MKLDGQKWQEQKVRMKVWMKVRMKVRVRMNVNVNVGKHSLDENHGDGPSQCRGHGDSLKTLYQCPQNQLP